MAAVSCPCCGSSRLLRHARHNRVFWLCPSCRQEVLPLELPARFESVPANNSHA